MNHAISLHSEAECSNRRQRFIGHRTESLLPALLPLLEDMRHLLLSNIYGLVVSIIGKTVVSSRHSRSKRYDRRHSRSTCPLPRTIENNGRSTSLVCKLRSNALRRKYGLTEKACTLGAIYCSRRYLFVVSWLEDLKLNVRCTTLCLRDVRLQCSFALRLCAKPIRTQ